MQQLQSSEEERELANAMSPEDLARVRRIRSGVRDLSRAFRARHPFLDRHQSEIGLLCLSASLALMIGAALSYGHGLIPAWLTVLVVAFACSIAHEVEHDLIHRMYYPRVAWLRNAMMAVGWLMRPSTVNPWIRTRLHLHHHRISGTPEDVEERSITNGEPWGIKRLLMTADGFLATALRLPLARPRLAYRLLKRATFAYGPLAWLYHLSLVAFLYLHLQTWRGTATADMELLLPAVDMVAVVWVLPNLLRTFCLHFVSSNIHYYGDVVAGDVLRQTQVVDRWFFLPLQLFCFNFGSTHAIHHFWVSEPFYLRQLTAAGAHEIMRANGVRFNDLATFSRANRYRIAAPVARAEGLAAPLASGG
ncbi:MAG: Fatty acid desaturase [Myxococcaceae bacterium]|nr:Fatty acid desaturase [Myxococcaceae bacterium]